MSTRDMAPSHNDKADFDNGDTDGEGGVRIHRYSTGVSVRPVQIDVRSKSQESLPTRRSSTMSSGTPSGKPVRGSSTAHPTSKTTSKIPKPDARPTTRWTAPKYANHQDPAAHRGQPGAAANVEPLTRDKTHPADFFGVPETVKMKHRAFYQQNPWAMPVISAEQSQPRSNQRHRADRVAQRLYTGGGVEQERASRLTRHTNGLERRALPSEPHSENHLGRMSSRQWLRNDTLSALHHASAAVVKKTAPPSSGMSEFYDALELQSERSATALSMSGQSWEDKADRVRKTLQHMQANLQRFKSVPAINPNASGNPTSRSGNHIREDEQTASQDKDKPDVDVDEEQYVDAQEPSDKLLSLTPEPTAVEGQHAPSPGPQLELNRSHSKRLTPAALPPINTKQDNDGKPPPPMIAVTGYPTPPESSPKSESHPLPSAPDVLAPSGTKSCLNSDRPDSPKLAAASPSIAVPAGSRARQDGGKGADSVSRTRTTILGNVYASSAGMSFSPALTPPEEQRAPHHRSRSSIHRPEIVAQYGHARNFSFPYQPPEPPHWHRPQVYQPRYTYHDACCELPSCYHKRMTSSLSNARVEERITAVERLFGDVEAVLIRYGPSATYAEPSQIMRDLDTLAHEIIDQWQRVIREHRTVKHGVALPLQSPGYAMQAIEQLIFDGLMLSLHRLESAAKQAEDILMSMPRLRSVITGGHAQGTGSAARQRSTDGLSSRTNHGTTPAGTPCQESSRRRPRPTSLPAKTPGTSTRSLRWERSLPDLNAEALVETADEHKDEPAHDQSFFDPDGRKPKKSLPFKNSIVSLKQRIWSNDSESGPESKKLRKKASERKMERTGADTSEKRDCANRIFRLASSVSRSIRPG